jgi:Fic family protein
MSKYNWQMPDWPHFYYDLADSQDALIAIAEKSGFIKGKITHLTNELQTEAVINLMVEEAVKTSEIEGEFVSRPDVRSSIKNKLGVGKEKISVQDKRAQGVVDMIFAVQKTMQHSLTEKQLFDWHEKLFSGADNRKMKIGCWRSHAEAMQIISGHHGKQIVHFEAPPSRIVPAEMKRFIHWFNETTPGKAKSIAFAPVRAAIVHLYFESIHPFEDGNGRIGRALAEKALGQGFGYPAMLSLSQAIEADKKSYYSALKQASATLDATEWVHYFVNVIVTAQQETESQINFTLQKAIFFDKYKNALNDRQLQVIHRMLKAGIKGFQGGMSAQKYMRITGTSKATATRDLQQLHAIGAFRQLGHGRSVRYELNL